MVKPEPVEFDYKELSNKFLRNQLIKTTWRPKKFFKITIYKIRKLSMVKSLG